MPFTVIDPELLIAVPLKLFVPVENVAPLSAATFSVQPDRAGERADRQRACASDRKRIFDFIIIADRDRLAGRVEREAGQGVRAGELHSALRGIHCAAADAGTLQLGHRALRDLLDLEYAAGVVIARKRTDVQRSRSHENEFVEQVLRCNRFGGEIGILDNDCAGGGRDFARIRACAGARAGNRDC